MTFDYLVQRALEEHLMILENSVCRGAPADFSAYCTLVGEIRGIRFALSQLAEARKRANVDEDES